MKQHSIRIKGFFVLLFSVLVTTAGNMTAQTFNWIKNAGNNNRFTSPQAVTIDNHHNEIVSGFVNDSTHFGTTVLPFYYDLDCFLAKYDSSGNFLWAINIGGPGREQAYRTATDTADNIYVVGGYMSGNLHLSPTDSMTLTAPGAQNFFVAKYDKNGNFLWARHGGSLSSAGAPASFARGVAVDPSGNVVIGGYYTSAMSFAGTTTTLASGTTGLFIAKYTPTGTFVWGKGLTSTSNCAIAALATDNAGNVFGTGKINNSVYDGIMTVANISGGDHSILFKYNPSGTLMWFDTLGKAFLAGSNDNNYGSGNALAVDNTGNVYMGGAAMDTLYNVFIPGGTYRVVYRQSGYLAKYTNAGVQSWIHSFGDDSVAYQGSIAESNLVNGVALDATGNVYAAGDFISNTTFGGLSMMLPSIGTGFIGKFNPATGNAVWIKTGGGLNGNQTLDIAVDHNGGGIATTGVFQGYVTFDATTISSTSTALTYQDLYLARQMNPISTLSIEEANSPQYSLYPNPAATTINIVLGEGVYHNINIVNLSGQSVLSAQSNNTSIQLDVHALAPGMYSVLISDNHGETVTARFVKSR